MAMQALQLGVFGGGARRALGAGLIQHLLVLLRGRALQRFSRHQLAQGRGRAHVHLGQCGRYSGAASRQKATARDHGDEAQQKVRGHKAHAGIIDKTRIHHVRRVPPASPSASTPPPVTPAPAGVQTLRVCVPGPCQPAYAGAGVLGRAAAAAGAGHAGAFGCARRVLTAHHWLPELGGPGLWFQVGVGAAGGPAADSAAHALAGAAARLAAAVAVLVVAGLVGMAVGDPRDALGPIVWCALAVALARPQDIALDAFRIDRPTPDHQAALAASYQTGYRLAMIWAGAGVLWIADRSGVLPALGQGRQLPERRLDDGLPGDGGVDGGGHGDGAVLERPPRCNCPRQEPGRVAERCGGGAVCRLSAPLRLARRSSWR